MYSSNSISWKTFGWRTTTLMVVVSACYAGIACEKSNISGEKTVIPNKSSKSVVAPIEWPRTVVDGKRFGVFTDITAFYLSGYAEFDALPISKTSPRPWVFSTGAQNVRQYLVGNSSQAIGVYNSECFSSLVLIYPLSQDQVSGKQVIHAATSGGSLQAWILRHPHAIKPDPHVDEVWLTDWDRFISASGEERSKLPEAIPLEGTIEISYSPEGLIKEGRVDLRSSRPVPEFREFFDNAKELTIADFDSNSKDEPAEQLEKERKELLADIEKLQSHPSDTSAQIKGMISGGWGPTLHIVWP